MISYLRNHQQLINFIKDKKNLSIYCCGPTIYKNLHKGNYRSLILLDYIFKARKLLNLVTKVVVNITDIDDKIFNCVGPSPIRDLLENSNYITNCEKVLNDFYKNLALLNLSYKEWLFVRVSEELPALRETILRITNLVYDQKGIKNKELPFYLWKGGHLLFSDSSKEYPFQGHPSWHLECSHIINRYLGQDNTLLHLGGVDLKGLHHLNEVEILSKLNTHNLSEIVFAHSGLYQLENLKMSKSLKNEKYLSENGLLEIINYYVSEFNRPLVETESRNKELVSFVNTIKRDNTYEEPTLNRINQILAKSPSLHYRTNKEDFIYFLHLFSFL